MCNATSESGHNVTSCYTTANKENYCFYTDGSVLSWDDAREFCARRNSTLPIINNENIDNAFQQFLINDSYNMTQNNYVWIGAHAQTVQDDNQWYWINGQSSGFQWISIFVKLLALSYKYAIVNIIGTTESEEKQNNKLNSKLNSIVFVNYVSCDTLANCFHAIFAGMWRRPSYTRWPKKVSY